MWLGATGLLDGEAWRGLLGFKRSVLLDARRGLAVWVLERGELDFWKRLGWVAGGGLWDAISRIELFLRSRN